jgi:hypothetical protein
MRWSFARARADVGPKIAAPPKDFKTLRYTQRISIFFMMIQHSLVCVIHSPKPEFLQIGQGRGHS